MKQYQLLLILAAIYIAPNLNFIVAMSLSSMLVAAGLISMWRNE